MGDKNSLKKQNNHNKKNIPLKQNDVEQKGNIAQNHDHDKELGFKKTCKGSGTFTGVGPKQATGIGALGIAPPNDSVAISPESFGLPYKTVSERITTQKEIKQNIDKIRIAAPKLSEYVTGDTTFTIGDVGDKNIRNSKQTRFDIYRFKTKEDALNFGKRTVPITITGVPDNWKCPKGSEESFPNSMGKHTDSVNQQTPVQTEHDKSNLRRAEEGNSETWADKIKGFILSSTEAELTRAENAATASKTISAHLAIGVQKIRGLFSVGESEPLTPKEREGHVYDEQQSTQAPSIVEKNDEKEIAALMKQFGDTAPNATVAQIQQVEYLAIISKEILEKSNKTPEKQAEAMNIFVKDLAEDVKTGKDLPFACVYDPEAEPTRVVRTFTAEELQKDQSQEKGIERQYC